jgi:putative membrane protein
MLLHIALMNAGGLALASILLRRFPAVAGGPASIAGATLLQIGLLWGWHAPPVLAGAAHAASLGWIMPATLLVASTWFWIVVSGARGAAGWSAVLALLLTSKLFCLLGVLYVFAPRVLYPELSEGAHHAPALSDQQLAGLLMLIACPICYVLTALRIASRLIDRLGGRPLPIQQPWDLGQSTHADLS